MTHDARLSSLGYNRLRLSTTTPSSSAERNFPLGEPGFHYQDLHREDRLGELDRAFLNRLAEEAPELHARLTAYRANPGSVNALERSRLLVDAARPLGEFIARLFGIENEWRRQGASAGPEAVLFRFRRDFLLRRAVKTKLPPDLERFDPAAIAATARAIERELHPELPWDSDPELATAEMAVRMLDVEADFIATIRQKKKPEISPEAREAARAPRGPRRRLQSRRPAPRRRGVRRGAPRFPSQAPRAVCPLVPPSSRAPRASPVHTELGLVQAARNARLPESRRDGAPRPGPSRATGSGPAADPPAARGVPPDRPADDPSRDPGRDALLPALPRPGEGLLLQGLLRRQDDRLAEEPPGHPAQGLSARRKDLGDAPASPGGRLHRRARPRRHRQPDVPRHRPPHLQRLHEGLHLPEAGPGQHPADRDGRPDGRSDAALGSRDLRPADALESAARRAGPSPRPYNGKNVLVVGLGPAGYTLAHYLLNEGFGVVGIDGLKIEPLPADWTGADGGGIRPIRDWTELAEPLDERPLAGFGGVSEYGITVRWDKNFLTLIHLTLAAPPAFRDPGRRSIRRHARRRAGLRLRVRPRRDRRRRRAADDHPDEEQHHPRRPQGLRLPDGPAADRRLQGRGARQPAGSSCRRSSSAAA